MQTKRNCYASKSTSCCPFAESKIISPLQSFDRIEWLKKRVAVKKLVDRTVKAKYLTHPGEAQEQEAINSVFERFDDNGNRIYTNKKYIFRFT